MVEARSLSSDIDLIKEFEELRIKQKLLIETLSKKDEEMKDSLLGEINSKLDFLVKIFQDASQDTSSESAEESKKHFETIISKIDSLEGNMVTRLEELESKLSNQKIEGVVSAKKQSAPLDSNSTSVNGESPKGSGDMMDNMVAPGRDFSSSKNSDLPPPPPPVAAAESPKEKKKGNWF